MTDHARKRKPRSGTATERIVTAGLATATCIGVVGLLGTRMVAAQEVTAEPAAPESTPVLLAAPTSTAASAVTSSSGLTQADLDAYANLLIAEKGRLDAYRADLLAAAQVINAAAAGQSVDTVAASGANGSAGAGTGKAGRTAKTGSGKAGSSKPATAAPAPAAAAAPPAVPSVPAPAPRPAPAAAAPPAQAAPAPQSYTKGS